MNARERWKARTRGSTPLTEPPRGSAGFSSHISDATRSRIWRSALPLARPRACGPRANVDQHEIASSRLRGDRFGHGVADSRGSHPSAMDSRTRRCGAVSQRGRDAGASSSRGAGGRRPPARWRSGTAHILGNDDGKARTLTLGCRAPWRRLCVRRTAVLHDDPVTARIDLDPIRSSRR